jgi:hypothetical protein
MTATPLAFGPSRALRNPNACMHDSIQRRIVSSLLLMRITPLPDRSASKIPAR